MFQTKITSQGTISLPASLRKKYGLVSGEIVTIEDTGRITIVKNTNFDTIRQRNMNKIKNVKKVAKNGDGLNAYVQEKYAK